MKLQELAFMISDSSRKAGELWDSSTEAKNREYCKILVRSQCMRIEKLISNFFLSFYNLNDGEKTLNFSWNVKRALQQWRENGERILHMHTWRDRIYKMISHILLPRFNNEFLQLNQWFGWILDIFLGHLLVRKS